MDAKTLSSSFGRSSVYTSMIACGGGKNGSDSHANFAVATSHRVRNNPSASNHGVRACSPAPKRPSHLPLAVAAMMPPAMINAAIASAWVRDQSLKSSHNRHESPKPTHARLANTPVPLASNDVGSDSGRPANAAPSSTDCGSATVLDAEYVDINPLRKFRCIGARLEDGDELQIVRIGLELLLEHRPYRVMMMGVIPDHRLQILQARGLRRIGLERCRGLVRILRGKHRRIEQRLRDGARDVGLVTHKTAAQSHDAAGLVVVLAVKIGGDFLIGRVLQPEISDRIGGKERLDFALFDRELQEIAGIGPPIDVLVGIDALLGELDREKILVRSCEVADRDDLALEVGKLVDARIRARRNAHAATMGSSGDLDVRALLERFQPAQWHAEPGICLASRDSFQELICRSTVVHQLDVQVLLLEKAVVDGDGKRREADCAGVPGQFQFSRRAGRRRRIGGGLADRELREIDVWRRSAERKGLRAEYAHRRRKRRRGSRAQQYTAIEQRPILHISRHLLLLLSTAWSRHRRNAMTLRPGPVFTFA